MSFPFLQVVIPLGSLRTPAASQEQRQLQDRVLAVLLLSPGPLDLFVCFPLLSNYADIYYSTAVVWEGKR